MHYGKSLTLWLSAIGGWFLIAAKQMKKNCVL